MERRWELVVLLWFAYFFHQADKQIYSVLLAPIRETLHLSGYQAGLVATVLTLIVACVSPIAGALGDRLSKSRVLTTAVLLWSLGTAATGSAGSFAVLLLARSIVTGGAEAFYAPVSHALLAEHHGRTRALAISIHQTAQYAGPIASGFIAGWIAERFGWPRAFLLFGAGGVVLSLVMAFRLPSSAATPIGPLFGGFRDCLRIAAVRRIGLAFAAVLFVSVGYSTWAPSLFGQQFGLSLSQAGFQTAFWSSAAAMLGALAGGYLSDRLANSGRSRFDLQTAALLAAVPFLVWLGTASTLPAALAALAGAGFFRGIYEGTLAVSLYDHVEPRYRSSAAAIVLVIANLLAAPSAAVLGYIADRAPLGTAISALSLCFIAAAGILYSSRKLPLRINAR